MDPALAAYDGIPLDAPEFRLLNDYQRGFPLIPQPFARIARECGTSEAAVLTTLQRWTGHGLVSRVGAVFAPRRIGASALAALSAPADRLESIAERVNAIAEVNHNYEREHAFNLWFVITAASSEKLRQVVARIEHDTGCPVTVLPLEEEFHIDLGFDLAGPGTRQKGVASSASPPIESAACALPTMERRLMARLQGGLSLQSRPFEALGRGAGLSEAMTIELIERWLDDGLVKRFGIVVRHHELGFRANAMCVWDVEDDRVGDLGRRLAAESAVTLCYRRTRALPDWPYNLFCMIHGRSREAVLEQRRDLVARFGLERWPSAVLFSTRRFKQHGARYLEAVA